MARPKRHSRPKGSLTTGEAETALAIASFVLTTTQPGGLTLGDLHPKRGVQFVLPKIKNGATAAQPGARRERPPTGTPRPPRCYDNNLILPKFVIAVDVLDGKGPKFASVSS